MYEKAKYQLEQLQRIMQELALWQATPPEATAFDSVEPFCIDTMNAHEWLQWVFIPRMYAIIESNASLPHKMAIVPYIEEALKEKDTVEIQRLIEPLRAIEEICNTQNDYT
ncbi:YqcC family protein [Avibacterium sp. 21-586]|uniref:YqcC family protein n=1 Tax=Avibacterium sp. 21-586 TaxID=2911534 RepID=UPI002245852C|nr:YqcC family protein [Avibacterium sp. 21-586]MCW9709668.1 YqcC family protein [Avibacterium sp. 21-586]